LRKQKDYLLFILRNFLELVTGYKLKFAWDARFSVEREKKLVIMEKKKRNIKCKICPHPPPTPTPPLNKTIVMA